MSESIANQSTGPRSLPGVGRLFFSLSSLLRRLPEIEATRLPCVNFRSEAVFLSLTLIIALSLRVCGYRWPLTPPNPFGHSAVLHVADILKQGSFWSEWLSLFGRYQAGSVYHSAIMLPVAVAFQLILGPSLYLPVVFGSFWGLLSVFLAWVLGRVVVGQVFALTFAALLAVSPLQVVISRLGGVWIGALPHALAAIFVSYLAGKRQSVILGLVCAVLLWTTLYQHAAARIAIPLSFIFLAHGLGLSNRSFFASLGKILLAVFFGLSCMFLLSGRPHLGTIVWPEFSGYVGNMNRTSFTEALIANLAWIIDHTPESFRLVFLRGRFGYQNSPSPGTLGWLFEEGGYIPIPIVLLGVIGLIRCLIRPRKHWPWIAFAAVSFLIPICSVPMGRRLLMFDASWSALAAHGILFLFTLVLSSNSVNMAVLSIPPLILLVYGTWTSACLVVHRRDLPAGHVEAPFLTGPVRDGTTCLRCFSLAQQLSSVFIKGGIVILFDSDSKRENLTSPAGLRIYSEISALRAARENYLIDFYSVMANVREVVFIRAAPYYSSSETFGDFIGGRIHSLNPPEILWHFETPTRWELWLAHQLRLLGGRYSDFDTPLTTGRGFSIITTRAVNRRAILLLLGISRSLQNTGAAEPIQPSTQFHSCPVSPLFIGVRAVPDSTHTIVGGWNTAWVNGFELPLSCGQPVGVDLEMRNSASPQAASVLCTDGTESYYEFERSAWALKRTTRVLDRTGGTRALGCAVRIRETWWFVDPISGRLSAQPRHSWIPKQPWIGLTKGREGELVLLSAQQEAYIFDVEHQRQLNKFSVVAPPVRAYSFGECVPMGAGTDWLSVLSPLTATIVVYERNGHELSRFTTSRGTAFRQRMPLSSTGSGEVLWVGFSDNSLEPFPIRSSTTNSYTLH